MILLITSLVIFWAYNIWTFLTIGIKSSISSTVNYIKNPWWFRLFIFGISVPIMFYAVNIDIPSHPDKVSIGLVIAASLISWVGLAHCIRGNTSKNEDILHGTGALGGILAGYIALAIGFVQWGVFYKDVCFWAIILFLISSFVILPIGNFKKPVPNHTTYIEIVAFNIIIITLMIKELL